MAKKLSPFACPKCGTVVQIPPLTSKAFKNVPCPKCNYVITVDDCIAAARGIVERMMEHVKGRGT